MKLTTKGRYAVMAMVDLAANENIKPVSLNEIALRQNMRREDFRQSYDHIFSMWEERKARWNETTKDCPSLYQYLKDNIHKGHENVD